MPQYKVGRDGEDGEDVQWINSDARVLSGVFLKVNFVMVTRTVGKEKMKSLVVSMI